MPETSPSNPGSRQQSNVRVEKAISWRFEFTGSEECRPCYWMDEACAPGTNEFLKGQGGLRARIVSGGKLFQGESELRVLDVGK